MEQHEGNGLRPVGLRSACSIVTVLLLSGCAPASGVATGATSTGSNRNTTTEATPSTPSDSGGPDSTSTADGGSSGPPAGDEGSDSIGSTSTDGGGSSDTSGTGDPIEDAIARGIEGAVALADADLVMLLLTDVIHRRFGIAELADSASHYDALLAQMPDPPIDALAFRRVFDHHQLLTADELAKIAPGVNEVTVPALFCDTLPLAPDYPDRLVSDAALGGYELTHVVLALRWIDELSCPAPLAADVVDGFAVDTFALIDTSDGLEDVEIEAALFGTLLAGPDGLPSDIVDALLAAQLEDGTWPQTPGDTEGAWHATGLGLMLLLELDRRPLDGFLAS